MSAIRSSGKPLQLPVLHGLAGKSAATRIAVLTAGLLIIATILLGGAAVGVTYMVMAASLDRSIDAAATRMLDLRRMHGRAAMIAAIEERDRTGSGSIDLAAFDARGRLIAGRPGIRPPPAGWHDMLFPDPVEGDDPTRVLMVRLVEGEHLMIAGNRRPLMIARAAIGGLFLVSIILITILCIFVGWLLRRYFNRRLRPITQTAEAVIAGDFTRRVPERGTRDELDQVALSLNLMLDRIAGLISNLRQVSSDVAHDLRTPLTRVRTGLENARRKGCGGADQDVQTAIVQIDDIVMMFDAMLRIAHIGGSSRADMTPIDLGLLAAEIAETMSPAFEAQGIALRCSSEPGITILADRLQIAAALINLLENVLHHAENSDVTEVTVARSGPQVVLAVRDNGPGAPEADLKRMFDRFVRLDPSRTRGGYGLGLSIVRAVAEAHGAGLDARNVEQGLVVSLVFPRFEPVSFANAR